MNIEVLDRLKLIEHDHTLNILVINHNADIPMSDLVQLPIRVIVVKQTSAATIKKKTGNT